MTTATRLCLATVLGLAVLCSGCDRGDQAQHAVPGKPAAELPKEKKTPKTQLIRSLMESLDQISKEERVENADGLKESLLRADEELSKVLGRENLQRLIARANQKPVRGGEDLAPRAKPGGEGGAKSATNAGNHGVRELLKTLEGVEEPAEIKELLRKALLNADEEISRRKSR